MEINIEERVNKAKRLFKEEGYNCCQAVVLAYNDIFGIDDNTAAALSSGFGGGMGRMREVCGSVSGMVMLAGLLCPANDPHNKDWRTANYALVQELAERFKADHGTIICRELLTGIKTSSSSAPEERTPEYYAGRPCAAFVVTAAEILDEIIAEKSK
jgi:C_GCAxxG_C_C family probable redox protein